MSRILVGTRPFDEVGKGGFFSESVIRFLNLQKKIFQKTILSLKFKFQVKDSFLDYSFWRFEKRIALSEKKPPLEGTYNQDFTKIVGPYIQSRLSTVKQSSMISLVSPPKIVPCLQC